MTLRSSDLQSDGDLDSIRNSCDVFFSYRGHAYRCQIWVQAGNAFDDRWLQWTLFKIWLQWTLFKIWVSSDLRLKSPLLTSFIFNNQATRRGLSIILSFCHSLYFSFCHFVITSFFLSFLLSVLLSVSAQHPVVRVVPTQGLQNEPGEQARGGGGTGGRGQARARGAGGWAAGGNEPWAPVFFANNYFVVLTFTF